tara:strand:- start:190 stop:348 length:159 start_codon:yes stop_codon:yes gene_type:complete
MTLKNFIKEYLYYYKICKPKYGWLWSIEYARFNALHLNRDGTYRHKTPGGYK